MAGIAAAADTDMSSMRPAPGTRRSPQRTGRNCDLANMTSSLAAIGCYAPGREGDGRSEVGEAAAGGPGGR